MPQHEGPEEDGKDDIEDEVKEDGKDEIKEDHKSLLVDEEELPPSRPPSK